MTEAELAMISTQLSTNLKSSDIADKSAVGSAAGQQQPQALIRILDIGSCYNPFLHCSRSAAYALTALDLRPAHDSVLQCDFLSLAVGPHGSEPVVEAAEPWRRLLRLPERSYDAVALSLVLSYLPTPQQRRQMLSTARRLLVSDGDQPHHAGLLVIFEKQSIFHSDKYSSWYLDCWKETIAAMGFSFLGYERLPDGDRLSHGLVFRTGGASWPIDPAARDAGDNPLPPGELWIKQDETGFPALAACRGLKRPREEAGGDEQAEAVL